MAFGTAKNYKGYTPKLTCERFSWSWKLFLGLINLSEHIVFILIFFFKMYIHTNLLLASRPIGH